jgi:hypothetical protein
MILFPEKMNLQSLVKGTVDDTLASYMKPDALKNGKETIDNIKTDLEKYLFQDLMDGEDVEDTTSAKKVAESSE